MRRERDAIDRARAIRTGSHERNVLPRRMGEPEKLHAIAAGCVRVVAIGNRVAERHDLAGRAVGGTRMVARRGGIGVSCLSTCAGCAARSAAAQARKRRPSRSRRRQGAARQLPPLSAEPPVATPPSPELPPVCAAVEPADPPAAFPPVTEPPVAPPVTWPPELFAPPPVPVAPPRPVAGVLPPVPPGTSSGSSAGILPARRTARTICTAAAVPATARGNASAPAATGLSRRASRAAADGSSDESEQQPGAGSCCSHVHCFASDCHVEPTARKAYQRSLARATLSVAAHRASRFLGGPPNFRGSLTIPS